MSLSFLAPLFLAGLAALAIPVIIHLRRQHERREREFPSLMFLRDIPFRSERRRNLRDKLLLALRLLALALLVTAFARPFLQGSGTAAAGVVGPREIVLLVDRSMSMSYGEHWERAGEAVREATTSLGPQDRLTLVLFDEGADAPVRSTPERERILRIVEDAAPTDRATRLAPALRLARSVLETSRLPRREVVLVSDFQESGWSAEDDVSLPPGVEFRPVPVTDEDEEWSNVTVASVELRRSEAGGRDAVVPTARVVRRGSGQGAGGSVVAVLEVDGRERERVEASLEGGGGRVTFGPVPLADRPLRATVRVEEDALPRDDAHHLVLSPGRRISVLVVEPPRPRENASLYLRRALELSRDPAMRVEVTSGSVPSDAAEAYDVIVLNDRPLRGQVAELRELLSSGGGVLWAPGAGADGGAESALEVGAAALEVRDHETGDELRLGSVDREHPVFEPFRESGTGNFSAARFFRTWRLRPADSARTLARFDDGSPALVEARPESGRMLVWAATLHTFWTDLPLQPVFVPFVHRAVVHLANQDEEIPSYRVGQVVAPTEPGSDRAGAPARSSADWSAVLTPGGERVALGDRSGPLVLEEAGFYELLEEEQARSGVPVAVNVDPREGDLSRQNVGEIAAAVGPPQIADTTGAAAEGDALAGGLRAEDQERHQGLWRFLLVGAFLFLVGETALSNRLSGTGARA